MLALVGCHGFPVNPPPEGDLPPGRWIYVKGEAQVWCDNEDPYYRDEYATEVNFDVPEEDPQSDTPRPVGVTDSRMDDYECHQDYFFDDPTHATAPLGQCGPRVVVLDARMELVRSRVLYLRRYIDVDNPYLQSDTVHCRIFESGYLLPYEDWIDSIL